MEPLHLPSWAFAAGTLLAALAVYLLVWALAKRSLLRLAGHSAHSSRDISASIAHISLRWNGLRPDSYALISVIVSDPQLSFVTLPAEARPPRSKAASPGIMRRASLFHVRSLTRFGHAAGSCGMARFFAAAISFARFVVAVLVQTLILPLLASLIDLEVSRLSISWTPSRNADAPDEELVPDTICVRVRSIHVGWAARSGSVQGSEETRRQRRVSLGADAEPPVPYELVESLKNATSVTLRMKMAARVSWDDVQVYAVPSSVPFPRQAFPTAQADKLWSFGALPTWKQTCSAWGDDGDNTSCPESLETRSVLYSPGKGQLSFKTRLYTTIRFASVQDNPDNPDEPILSFGLDHPEPNETSSDLACGGWEDHFIFTLGPLQAALHTIGVDVTMPPVVADVNSILFILDHAKRAAERRRNRASVGAAEPAAQPFASARGAGVPHSVEPERPPAWLHLVHQSRIDFGGLRLLNTIASPDPHKSGEQEGALVAVDVGPITAAIDPCAVLEKQGILSWAWKLNRTILKQRHHPHIIDLIGTWRVDHISVRILPAFSPTQENNLLHVVPAAELHTLKGRCQVAVPIGPTPPVLHIEVGIAKLIGSWDLPSGKQGRWYSALLTALVRIHQWRPPEPQTQTTKLDWNVVMDRLLTKMSFVFQFEVLIRELEARLSSGGSQVLAFASGMHGGVFHLPPREDIILSRAEFHTNVSRVKLSLANADSINPLLDIHESSGEAALIIRSNDKTSTHAHAQGDMTGLIRAVRFRLDTHTSWITLEHLASDFGRLASQVQSAQYSIPHPPPVARAQQPAPAVRTGNVRSHSYRLYANLNLLDFDGRCAALDPKRHPQAHGSHPTRATQDFLPSQPMPWHDDGIRPSPTHAYQRPLLCPPLGPTKSPVGGFRASFPRWRVELAAVRACPCEDTAWTAAQNSRSSLHLEPDALDEASSRAQTKGKTVILRSSVHELQVLAVDPSSLCGEASRPSVTNAEADRSRHLLLHIPRNIFEVTLSPSDLDGQAGVAVSLRSPGCNILAIELANTYALFMALAACRRVWVSGKGEMSFPIRPKSSAPAQPDSRVHPNVQSRPVSCDISFGKLNVPIRLPNGLRLFLGVAGISARQALSFPLRTPEGALQMPKLLFKFRHLAGAVYQKRMGLWKPLNEQEWVQVVGWDDGTIEVDWSTTVPSQNLEHGSSSPLDGAETAGVEPIKHWPSLLVTGKHARLMIPFQFVFHEVVVGTSVAVKATKQLVHEALKGQLDYKVAPSEMKPIALPSIRLRLRTLVVEMEDSILDSHLRIKHRIGIAEAQRRVEREAAFEQQVQATLSDQRRGPSSERRQPRPNLHHIPTAPSLRRAGKQAAPRPNISPFRRSKESSRFSSSSPSFSERGEDSEESESMESTDSATATIKAARRSLNEYDSKQWIALARHGNDLVRQSEDQIRVKLRGIHLGVQAEELTGKPNAAESERPWAHLRDLHEWSPLFRSTMTHVDLRLSQPHSYTTSEASAREYINSFGDPIPDGLTFSVFVPMHLELEMEEWMCNLRDYPLPLVHVLPDFVKPFDPTYAPTGPAAALSAFRLATDLCIAEQMGDERSMCHFQACLVHDDCLGACGSDYVLHVPKVTMPTKMFGHPVVQIRSSLPLQLAWGQSMSPAIAEVTKAFDGFSSPPLDPSPKLGFWDKIPLILHGSFELLVPKPSAVQLFLKGSRDPYNLRGHGAGWVQVWSNGVRAVMAPQQNKENQVIQIFSGSYELAIPDLNVFTGPAACSLVSLTTLPTPKAGWNSTEERVLADEVHTVKLPPLPLQKIVWSLNGNVVWGCGFVLERTCNGSDCVSTPKCSSPISFYRQCRFFNKISHWNVLPRTPEYLNQFPSEKWGDTYTGWRHHHVHLSMSVQSHASQSKEVTAANSLHVTPLVSSHFWAWIHLFNSALSLPIRAGALFPSLPSPSPKFGQHCATIKYRIDLAPMSLAHIYLQHDAARHKRGANLFLGLKARVGSFNVDLHQRQQEMFSTNKATGKTQTVLHKPLSAAEVDFRDGELRGCVAKILDLSRAAHWVEMTGGSADFSDDSAADLFLQDGPDESHGDASGWWDFRDYVELGGRIGREPQLRSTRARSEKILEWPAFNYFRRNPTRKEIELQVKALQEQAIKDGNMAALEDAARQAHHLGAYGTSKFGHEGTHSCLMGQDQTPDEIQDQLLSRRINELRAGPRMPHTKRSIHIVRDFAACVPAGMESFKLATSEHKEAFPEQEQDVPDLVRLKSKVHEDGLWSVPTYVPDETIAGRRELSEIHGHWSNFANRYVFHNPILHIQEGTRNILLRYYISNRLRRGQTHFLRYVALKSIQDLRMGQKASSNPSGEGVEMLRTLLEDTIALFVDKTQPAAPTKSSPSEPSKLAEADPYRGIRPELEVRRGTVCAILRPQIVFHSRKDDAPSIVLTAVRLRLEVFGVRDPTALDNDLNSHVLNRSWFFSDHVKVWATKAAAERVFPIEAIIDPVDQEGQQAIWEGFHQLTSQLSLQVQFDHFNPLRIANEVDPTRSRVPFQVPKDQEHLLHRTDLVRVTAPPLNVVADAEQFEATTNATTLLLYSDPAHKQRQEQLKTLLLAYDFTDSRNLTRVVSSLQHKIRDTTLLHEEYEASYGFLTQQGRFDAGECIAHLRELIEEVTLFMDAVKTAQDQQSGDQDKKSGLRLEANAERIVWTMLRSQAKSRLAFRRTEQENERLAELHVQGTSFTWLSKADSSIANALSIQDVEARDVRPDAIFPVILSKHKHSNDDFARNGRFLEAVWQVLAPVAGISIVDWFEVDVHPLNIQLEKAVGSEIADYAFASRHKRVDSHEEKRSGMKLEQLLDTSATGPSGRDSDSVQSSRIRSPSRHSGLLKFRASRASHHGPRRTESGGSDPMAPVNSRSLSERNASTTSLTPERVRQPAKSNRPLQESNLAAFNRMDDVDENTMRMASEMRERAARNRTFVYVRIPKAVICLSYRGDNKYMNLYDSIVQTPQLELCQTTGTLEDVMNEFKKAVIRAAWSQKTTLLKGVLRHRPGRITKRLVLRDKLRKQAASTSVKAQRRKSAGPKPNQEQRTGYISATSSDLELDVSNDNDKERGASSSLADTPLSATHSFDKGRVQNLLNRLHSPPVSTGSTPSGSGSGLVASGPGTDVSSKNAP